MKISKRQIQFYMAEKKMTMTSLASASGMSRQQLRETGEVNHGISIYFHRKTAEYTEKSRYLKQIPGIFSGS